MCSSLHIDMRICPQANSSFARALALELGASQCEDNNLMFFVDVDMTFSPATLDRIRLHTIRGQQVGRRTGKPAFYTYDNHTQNTVNIY